MSTRSYSILASLTLLILALLLFIGPAMQEDPNEAKAKSKLWDEDWQVIEYYAEGSKEPKLRFIRQSGLWQDLYYIEAPLELDQSAAGQNSQELMEAVGQDTEQSGEQNTQGSKSKTAYPKRRGNHFVKNTFSDWRNPNLLAYYKLEAASAKQTSVEKSETKLENKQGRSSSEKGQSRRIKEGSSAQEAAGTEEEEVSSQRGPITLKQAEIEDTSPRLYFYKSKNTAKQEPFILILGKRLSNRRVLTHFNKESALLLALPKHLLNHFKKPALSYRSRDILHFPSKAYIKSVEIRLEKKAIRLEQTKIEEEGRTHPKWSFKDLRTRDKEREFNAAMGSSLKNALRQLKIHRFADDEELQKFPPSEELWQEAQKNYLDLKVEIAEGRTYRLFVRKSQKELKAEEKAYALLQSSEDSFTDFLDLERLEKLTQKLESIEKLIAAQKGREKRAKEAAVRRAAAQATVKKSKQAEKLEEAEKARAKLKSKKAKE